MKSPITGEFPSHRASNADLRIFDVGPHKLLNSRMTDDLRLDDVHVASLQLKMDKNTGTVTTNIMTPHERYDISIYQQID